MTAPPSMEFWIAVLFVINLMVVVFLFFIVKKINRSRSEELQPYSTEQQSIESDQTSGATDQILRVLEPLVEESRQTAVQFDAQIKEKKRLIRELNEALDSRIISINLLLSRADAQQRKLEERQDRIRHHQSQPENYPQTTLSSHPPLEDQQNQILSLYYQNVDAETIARKLSVPKGEVQLVIDLKEKFVAMEKDSQ